ncbi:uncharacterized protein G2W53_019329 [Senna tora]|uniref:Uncharacterized protein n=1 Tax=Senna tora TaxID=362788 RepID=A0A834TTB3_9FABA|nr:uncharacterized protein G2W53_019329 [Senna tora]
MWRHVNTSGNLPEADRESIKILKDIA